MADHDIRELVKFVVCRGHCIAASAAVSCRHIVLDRMDAFRKLYVSQPYRADSLTSLSGTFAVIMLQMFIAVINENFDVAEEAKKGRQASHYWASQRQEKTQVSWMKKLNPYRWFSPAPKAIAVDNLPSGLVLPMQKALVQDYNVPKREPSTKVHSCGHEPESSLIAPRYLLKGRKVPGITPRVLSTSCKPSSLVNKPPPRYLLPTLRTYAGTARLCRIPTTMKWKATCE